MEELAEGAIKPILRLIRFIFIEAFCEFLCFWVGRLFLLTVTFGRYPSGRQLEEHEGRIILTGLLVIIASIILISIYV